MTSGFEVIVRPVVLPDIRPQSPRVLPGSTDPASGIATLSGSGGSLIDLSQSESHSWSRSRSTEVKRKYNVERIHKMDDDGNVDKSQFVDVERLKSVTLRDGLGGETKTTYADPPARANVETLKADQERIAPP
jgi:hypothetical protein